MVASVRQGLNNAGIKVTDLPVADLPLTGAEVAMIVQAGLSKQVSVLNLATGGAGIVSFVSGAGVQNNVAPAGLDATTKFLFVDTTAGNTQWGGLVTPGLHDQRIIMVNSGPNQLRLDAQVAGSAAANRFFEASNLILLANMATEIVYCTGALNRWIVLP
jgi:hypothetical protein